MISQHPNYNYSLTHFKVIFYEHTNIGIFTKLNGTNILRGTNRLIGYLSLNPHGYNYLRSLNLGR
jgi:hypothetical protein